MKTKYVQPQIEVNTFLQDVILTSTLYSQGDNLYDFDKIFGTGGDIL